jgi:hypothetical protein
MKILENLVSPNHTTEIGRYTADGRHVVAMPEEIGARDGFEAKEQQGDKNTDSDLMVMLQALRVQYPKESLTEIRER